MPYMRLQLILSLEKIHVYVARQKRNSEGKEIMKTLIKGLAYNFVLHSGIAIS